MLYYQHIASDMQNIHLYSGLSMICNRTGWKRAWECAVL